MRHRATCDLSSHFCILRCRLHHCSDLLPYRSKRTTMGPQFICIHDEKSSFTLPMRETTSPPSGGLLHFASESMIPCYRSPTSATTFTSSTVWAISPGHSD